MVVITLTNTPPKVKGDLTKWLFEIDVGVYVGNVSTRVREELWERICSNLQTGRAAMVFNTQNEQKLDFKVHNSEWEPIDFDGIKLIRHPVVAKKSKNKSSSVEKTGPGKTVTKTYEQKTKNTLYNQDWIKCNEYTVVDIETTGLSCTEDRIIEIAAIHIANKEVKEKFCKFIQCEKSLSETIIRLTGITEELLEKEGEPLSSVLQKFVEFIKKDKYIVCHNPDFDLSFIRVACEETGISMPWNFKTIDTLQMARQKVKGVTNYKLKTLGQYFGLDTSSVHRALEDCYLIYGLYEKLNEIE